MGEPEVSPERNQRTITLSDQAMEDFQMVADYLGMPISTLLRQKLEEVHQSPSFGALLRRIREVRANP